MGDHLLRSEEPVDNILHNLHRMRSHNVGDVNIICRDGTVVAHKIILASISEMLLREFSDNFRDETISMLVPDVDRKSVTDCLDTLYSRKEVSREETFMKILRGKHVSNNLPMDEEQLREAKIEEDDEIVEQDDEYDEDNLGCEEDEPFDIDDWTNTPKNDLQPVQSSSSKMEKKDYRRSIVWQHFERISKINYNVISRCNHCGHTVKSYGGATTRLLAHLKVHHPGYETNKPSKTNSVFKPTIIKFTNDGSTSVKEECKEEQSLRRDTESEEEEEEDEEYDPSKISRKSALRSVVWLHFTRNPEDHNESMCHRCGKILKHSGGSTSVLYKHLQNSHMEKDYDVEKHFSKYQDFSTCNYCGHMVKHGSTMAYNAKCISRHLFGKHPDIVDKKECVRSLERMDRSKLEQLPIVEPLFNNFDEARENAKLLDAIITRDKEDKEEKKKTPKKCYVWKFFSKESNPETQAESIVCQLCHKSYNAEVTHVVSLKIHLDRDHQICDPETGPQSHTCAQCGKSFNLRSDLVKHEWDQHMERKRYACTECEKTFKHRAGLTAHLRLHTGEKPFQCAYCGKTFGVKATLKMHLRVHSSETPEECKVCHKKFKFRSSKKKHKCLPSVLPQ